MKKFHFLKKKGIAPLNILPNCLNCGKPLSPDDNFCSYCGQKNIEKLNFASFINQLISGLFSYDSRFWTTFKPLLFKPGKVSRNFIEGKRSRYVNPFQLYLHVSIIFFLFLGLANKSNVDVTKKNKDISLDSIVSSANDELKSDVEIDSINSKIITDFGNGIKFSEKIVDSTFNIDSKKEAPSELSISDRIEDFYSFNKKFPKKTNTKNALNELGYPITFWNSFFFEQTLRLVINANKIKDDGGKGFLKSLISYLSIGLFIFLPVFTLFLKLIYFRKKMNYMEHLVFVFHTQTVFFLLLTISTIIGLISNASSTGLFLLLFLIYLFLALQKFYKQRWLKTFIKFVLLNVIYTGIGVVAMLIISIIAFMFD